MCIVNNITEQTSGKMTLTRRTEFIQRSACVSRGNLSTRVGSRPSTPVTTPSGRPAAPLLPSSLALLHRTGPASMLLNKTQQAGPAAPAGRVQATRGMSRERTWFNTCGGSTCHIASHQQDKGQSPRMDAAKTSQISTRPRHKNTPQAENRRELRQPDGGPPRKHSHTRSHDESPQSWGGQGHPPRSVMPDVPAWAAGPGGDIKGVRMGEEAREPRLHCT